MNVQLHSTTKIVELQVSELSPPVKARIWEGVTDWGVRVHAYIAQIAIDEKESDEEKQIFAKELQEHNKPSARIEAIPLRLII